MGSDEAAPRARSAGGPRAGDVEAPPPAASLSLTANVGWTLAGNVTYAACQWAILVLIARLATEEAVGRLALASAVTTPVFLLTGLQLRGSVATDAAGRFRFRDYFGVRVAGVLAGLLGTGAVVAAAGFSAETRAVVLAVAVVRAIEGIADIHYAFLQQQERMRPIARSLMMRGILDVVIVGAVLWAGGGLAVAVLAFAASSVAVLFGYDVRAPSALLRSSDQGRLPRFHAPTARRIVLTSLPLGLVMLAVSLRTYIPRFFVERSAGTAELGVFAALSSLTVAGTLVVSALGQSAVPRLARHFHRDELAAFRRLVRRLVLVGVALGGAGVIVAAAAGRPLLGIVFGSSYAARADLLVWLMGAGLAAYASSFLGYALTAARLFAVQLPLFTATTLACAAGCWWLVPAHGLVGAACAWGASLLLEVVAAVAVLEVALRRRAAAAAATSASGTDVIASAGRGGG